MPVVKMSCNPAVGGIAKGQIVREIDALGGQMGIVTDRSAIQFRLLNQSKGPAMWSPRSQSDRKRFIEEWIKVLSGTENLHIWQDTAVSLIIKDNKVCGVKTLLGIEMEAQAVVLTNGTFLNGLMHCGKTQVKGGRISEPASYGLTEQLVELGFKSDRMKTGTPARVDARSIHFDRMIRQDGDDTWHQFSYLDTVRRELKQMPCWITYTNPVTGAKVQSLLQVKDMPGEDWQVLGFDSYVLNENRIPVIVIPMGDLIAKHEDQNYVSELDKYLMNYANKAKDVRLIKGYEPVKPIFIISNFDVAQTKLNNPEIEEIRNNGSSLVRDGKLRMSRHKNGLKLEYLRHVSRDLLLPFLRDYAGSILKRMQEICGEDEPMIFACAAVGQEPEKDKENGFIYPEGFVPFNLDEPLLYLLNREGMYPADSGEKGEEKNDRMLFWNILDLLTSMEYE